MTTKIDKHPQSKIIIKRLGSGEDYSSILLDFPTLTNWDLDYYQKNKLEQVLSKSPELKAEIEGEFGDDVKRHVCSLAKRGLRIMDEAARDKDPRLELMAMRETRGCFEAILKAGARMPDINVNTQVNYIQTSEWIALRTKILYALDPFPDAKEAVSLAIRG